MRKRSKPGEQADYYLTHVYDQTDDCVLWPYRLNDSGYGMIWVGGKFRRVHILACEHLHGPKQPGQEVCHSCRSRHCFNPRHLRWGTRAENAADRLRDGTHNRGEQHNMAKLTASEVLEIRSKYATGAFPQAVLAAMFGVTQPQISFIVNRKKWTHI